MQLQLTALSLAAAIGLSLVSSSSAQSLIYVLTTNPATTLIGPAPLKTTTAASATATRNPELGYCLITVEPPSNKAKNCDYYDGYCSPDSARCCEGNGGTITDETESAIGASVGMWCSVPGPKYKHAVVTCLEALKFTCTAA